MSPPRDPGFTLVETLVVVVMIGVLAVALAAVFGVIVRATPATTARADDARSLLGVTTWLPNDVSATPMLPLEAAGSNWNKEQATVSGCAGTDPAGINLVWLRWSETYGGSRTYRSSFRLVDAGESSYVARIHCVDGQAPTVSRLTADLPPIDAVNWTLDWKTQQRGGVEYLIGLVFKIDGVGTDQPGSTLRVDAVSKNLSETLAAPTPPPDYAPLPPGPPPPPAPNTAPVANPMAVAFQLGTPITITLAVSDDHDAPEALEPVLVLPSEPEWQSSIDPTDRRIVTITPPDDVEEGTYEIPYSVSDSGFPDTAPLTSNSADITLTLTTDPVSMPDPPVISPISPEPSFQRDAEISFVVVATDPDGDDAALDVTLSIPDPDTDPRFLNWDYHIDPANNLRVVIDGGPFVAGTYPITYRVTDESGLWAESSVTITLVPIPCAASFAPGNPTSAARINSGTGGRRLKDPVTITIIRSGDCVLALEYQPMDSMFTKSFGSASTTVELPATDVELWDKKATTTLRLVRTDPGPFESSTWSLETP